MGTGLPCADTPPPGVLAGDARPRAQAAPGWRRGRGGQEMPLIGEMHADCRAAFDVRLGRCCPSAPASPPVRPSPPPSPERSRGAPRTRDIDFHRVGGRGSHSVSNVRQLTRIPFRLRPPGPPSPPDSRGWGWERAPRRRARGPSAPARSGRLASPRPNTRTHINIALVQTTCRSLCLPPPPLLSIISR